MVNSGALSSRYEAGFCVFMAALAYLGKENPSLEYPAILHLFGILMVLNLLAGIALRRRPDAPLISTGFILANCGTITAILAYSGGASSNLWVLYLLPIFTVCLLLGSREAAGVTLGVVAFNAAFTLSETRWNWSVAAFEVLLKSGFFVFTALLAWRLVAKDRTLHDQLRSESRRADQLTTRLEGAAALSDVGLVSAGVAHDLRNAFMVILGFSDSILSDASLSAGARDALERIKRMARLGGEMAISRSPKSRTKAPDSRPRSCPAFSAPMRRRAPPKAAPGSASTSAPASRGSTAEPSRPKIGKPAGHASFFACRSPPPLVLCGFKLNEA